MARVIWKGSISFGLVNIPVALFSGEQREELSLTMLDKRDLAPVGYQRVNKKTGKEVPWDAVVKGYEYEEGEFVVLGDEEFRRANLKGSQTVEIEDFVDASEVPIYYFDRPYYLEPIQRGEKGYALLRETLKRTGKIGIAKVILRNRQHLAALMPLERLLVLELLRFEHELRNPADFKAPAESLDELGISAREVDMAAKLVESMTEAWTPEKYRDDYRDDLMAVIEDKIRRHQTAVLEKPSAEGKPRKGAEVVDLMALLKRSVEEKGQKKPAPKTRTKSKGTAARRPARKQA